MKTLLIKRTLNIVFLFMSTAVICQTANQQAKTIFEFLKAKQYDSILLHFDDYYYFKGYSDSCMANFERDLNVNGNIKKLIQIDEQEAGCKKDIALTIQFKKKKKLVLIRLNQFQKIETFQLMNYKETPFFQLKGYKGFSEVTDLTTVIKTDDGLQLGANIAFGDTEKQKLPIVIMMNLFNDRDATNYQFKSNRDIAQGLAQNGVVSLRVDSRFFTYNATYNQENQGMKSNELFMKDFISSIKHLKQFMFIDTNKIYIMSSHLSDIDVTTFMLLYPKIKGIISVSPNINEFNRYNDDDKFENKNHIPILIVTGAKHTEHLLEKDYNGGQDQVVMPKKIRKNHRIIIYPELNQGLYDKELEFYSEPNHIPQYVIDDVVEFIF